MTADDERVHKLLHDLEKAAADCKASGGEGPSAAREETCVHTLLSQLKDRTTENKELAAKLRKSDFQFDRLQTAFITLRHKLQGANKELTILKDPAVSLH